MLFRWLFFLESISSASCGTAAEYFFALKSYMQWNLMKAGGEASARRFIAPALGYLFNSETTRVP